MTSRRDFIAGTVAGIAAASVPVSRAIEELPVSPAPLDVSKGGRVGLSRIKAAIRREDTVLRLGGVGDCFHMSWAADDRQFVAVCDGPGWLESPKGFHNNSHLFAIVGGPKSAIFEDVPGYPEILNVPNTNLQNRFYGFGTLALDRCIYQFLGAPNHLFARPDGTALGARFIGAKLIYSPDNGRTWRNQDGSVPVVWEQWRSRSRQNMVFFQEPQDAFSVLSVLQMGRNYEANRDGYVYVYSPNGNTDGTMNELVMFRVPKEKILIRADYEYFGGLRLDGRAVWTKNITERAAVYTFHRGWVNSFYHPWAWVPSVTYNVPLGVYMMASWGMGVATDGFWFGKPSYLGFWIAPNPWGPWTQIHEEVAWTPENDPRARAYAPQISPKWIAADGKSFWLVWTDLQGAAEVLRDFQLELKKHEHAKGGSVSPSRARPNSSRVPYYAFNTQRVDLVIA